MGAGTNKLVYFFVIVRLDKCIYLLQKENTPLVAYMLKEYNVQKVTKCDF